MYAAYNGSVDTIAYLIKRGADVNAKDGMNMSALWVVIERGQIEPIKFLFNAGADKTRVEGRETALMFAIKSNQKDSIDALIESGSDVNERDANGITPLIIAVTGGNLEIVKFLVNLGADVIAAVDVESEHTGKTALIWAVEGRYIDVVRFLIDKG